MKTLNCVLAWGLLFLAGTDLWAIPPGFNIQGRLTDTNGINKDGEFQIKFSIFDAANTLVWEKNIPDVHVQNGNFQVVLLGQGDISVQYTELENAVKDLQDAYVEIKVGSDPPLVPRQPLMRSPFSSADKFLGAVMFFAGPTCPDGWLLANGAILPTTGADAKKYVDLVNYLGYIYDPNHAQPMLPSMLDGSFMRSIGGNAANLGEKQTDAFKSHTHTIPRRTGMGYSNVTSALGNSIWTPIESSPAGDAETRPLNYAMTPCIKY